MGIIEFPSPLEVYRFISLLSDDDSKAKELFPSPLEVYRFISIMENYIIEMKNGVSVPSRGI